MTETATGDTITHLLARWSQGERAAAEQLMPMVYDELRGIARGYFRRERSSHTWGSTALVHEVYITLTEQGNIQWRNRSHFFGLAACMMRRALVDYSRDRGRIKRGGKAMRAPLEEALDLSQPRPQDLIALDDALNDLEQVDPLKALIVELRFFGGLTLDEVGECIGLSRRTVARHWVRARAALYRELRTPQAKSGRSR